jgi:5-oxoprolinase (ATP-hydrolysing) subunit A
MSALFEKLHHICIVVPDIDKAQAWYESIGIAPWVSYPPLSEYEELDMPSQAGFLSLKYRICNLPNIQFQLCEPGPEPSPQRAHLDSKGEGVFHIGFEVPDADAAEALARAQGLPVLMRGRRANRTGFTYYDSASDGGVNLLTRATNLPANDAPMQIDLNSDLGEGYGPWVLGDDAQILDCVTSANIACGGHAGDPETMFKTLRLAAERGVRVGAHPGYADREGFGRRVIPMLPAEIGRMVVAQVGALGALARLAGTQVRFVKPHGALGNLAAADASVAGAIVAAVRSLDPALALLAISGTALETAAREQGVAVFSEIFADRAYLPNGQLVPRSQAGAVLHDVKEAADRLVGYLKTGLMPVQGGNAIALRADSICVHGDSPEAAEMARQIRARLQAEGVTVAAFLS